MKDNCPRSDYPIWGLNPSALLNQQVTISFLFFWCRESDQSSSFSWSRWILWLYTKPAEGDSMCYMVSYTDVGVRFYSLPITSWSLFCMSISHQRNVAFYISEVKNSVIQVGYIVGSIPLQMNFNFFFIRNWILVCTTKVITLYYSIRALSVETLCSRWTFWTVRVCLALWGVWGVWGVSCALTSSCSWTEFKTDQQTQNHPPPLRSSWAAWRSHFSMCGSHSISSKQLTQVDSSGMVLTHKHTYTYIHTAPAKGPLLSVWAGSCFLWMETNLLAATMWLKLRHIRFLFKHSLGIPNWGDIWNKQDCGFLK